ncbi:MAG: YbaK/EbsC family protein, partial [Deltaproteobacteria bacterium]|nr:YbaK/EbsC family protein [Deltaproteobacteria bacterium]
MSEGKRIVEEFFRKRGVEKKILSYEESTHDSHRAAQAIGVLLGQIAKSILFMADGKPVLVVISGEKKVN